MQQSLFYLEAMRGFKNESSIAFLRPLLETWIFLSVFFYANNLNAQTELTLENWMSLKNGRTRYLFGTTNKNKILNSFIPSGERVLISNEKTPSGISIKGWEIVIRHGVYYSNEENPDTSKDQPASVIVYRLENEEKQPYFAGKGYKFSLIKEPHTKIKPLFIIRHWSGVMGCSFIDLSFLETQKIGSKPVIEYRSTKTTVNDRVGQLCKAPTSSGLFLSD